VIIVSIVFLLLGSYLAKVPMPSTPANVATVETASAQIKPEATSDENLGKAN
jgi:hypothetical protein